MLDPYSTPFLPPPATAQPDAPRPDPAGPPPQAHSQPQPAPPELPVSNPLTPLLPVGSRRNGKVARKPKHVRDRINLMLLDGVTYPDIISALGHDGKDLNDDNLGRWRTGGYQEWLRERERIEIQERKRERAVDLAAEGGSKIHQANMQVAATNLCDLLLELEPASLRAILEEDPDKYTRLLNAVVRLSDGQLRCEQHQLKLAEQTKSPAAAQPGGISEASLTQAKEALNLM